MNDILEPPGSIAVLGAGPIGIEAALYARYLGYQVLLFEAEELFSGLRLFREHRAPSPSSSSLGRAALAAQRGGGGGTMVEVTPVTVGQWIDEYLEPLVESDLLAGRIRERCRVLEIRLAEADEEARGDLFAEDDSAEGTTGGEDKTEADTSEADGAEDTDGPELDETIPPDWVVVWRQGDGSIAQGRFEAVIDARGEGAAWCGPGPEVRTPSELPPYLYWLGRRSGEAIDYPQGLQQIRDLFAALGDRPQLDVYRNLGG